MGVCLVTMSSRDRFIALAKKTENYDQTVSYLKEKLSAFVRPQDKVLLCFSRNGEFSMAVLMDQVIRDLHAEPILWDSTGTWQSLLRQAFFSRATVAVGEPLLILGLTKLTKFTGVPLRIRNVLLSGAPGERWMVEGIRKGLDSDIWGCYDPIPGLVVGGFSCQCNYGIHLRTDAMSVSLDSDGRILLQPKSQPEVCFETDQRASFVDVPCPCGNPAPLLTDFHTVREADPALDGLQKALLSWTSVLDYRAARTRNGLELEVVAFPGERLPVLPSCARRSVRPWTPKHDVPFCAK